MSPIATATTTSPLAVVCYRTSPISMTVTMAPTSLDLEESDQHDVVLPPQLILTGTVRDSVGLATVLQQQQPQSEMPSWAYVNYAMGPPQVSFLFQSWASHQFITLYICACCDAYCFIPSGFHVTSMLTSGGPTVGFCNGATLWCILLEGIYACCWWSVSHPRSALSGCSFYCFRWGKFHATHSDVHQAFHLYGWTYSSGGWAENHLIPPHSLHGKEGFSFLGCVPLNDTTLNLW